MTLKTAIYILFAVLPWTSAMAVGESPVVYDARYGSPVESTGERTYQTNEWRITVFFREDAAVGVRYVGILAEKDSKMIPRELSQQDIETVLTSHDINSVGWSELPPGDQRRIWRRSDGGATAFTEDNIVLTVFDSSNPPRWWVEKDHTSAPLEDDAVDKDALRILSGTVIESRITNSVTYLEQDDVVNPDGTEVYVVRYKVNDSEITTRTADRTLISYDTVSVQFHSGRAYTVDNAVIMKGKSEERILPGSEEIRAHIREEIDE